MTPPRVRRAAAVAVAAAAPETVAIESVAPGGSGVGRLRDGRVVFVPGTLPGERVEIACVADHGRWLEAKVVRILEASPARVRPQCPYFGRCGGCQLQHAAYPLQLELKRQHVEETLRRIAKIPQPVVHPTLASPKAWEYRNRVGVHITARAVGFYEAGSRRVVDVERCAIASEDVNRQLAALRSRKPRKPGTRILREPAPFRGFRQVNAAAAELLAQVVVEMLKPGGDLLVEGFCGAGFFTLPASALFARVTALEWSRGAVQAARAAAPPHVRIVEGDVNTLLPELLAKEQPDALLLDPPAEGLSHALTSALAARPPAKVVYVSCNPATFARDVARMAGAFELKEVRPVDMFPQTAAIELAARLEKRAAGPPWPSVSSEGAKKE